jgi:D-3-phosphoglycerate dehydrogenase
MTGQFELPGARLRVLVTDHLAQRGIDLLQASPGLAVDVRNALDAAALLAECRTADALIVRSASRVTAELLRASPRLTVVGRAGVGVDNVDLEAATAAGVVVMNTPGGNAISAAEHTLSMPSAWPRISPGHRLHERREMGEGLSSARSCPARSSASSDWGGSGEVAKRAKAFNLRILVHDPYVSTELSGGPGVELADLPDLYRQADFVTIHVPGTEETRNLIRATPSRR